MYNLEEKCGNCRYFHKYKRYTSNGWEKESCCTVHVQQSKDKYNYDCFVMRVGEDDMCEGFYERDDTIEKYPYDDKLIEAIWVSNDDK